MKKWTKVLSAFVVATVMSAGMAAAAGCDGCGGDDETPKHEHNYTWVDNGDGKHKGTCDVDGCDEPEKLENHVDANENNKCDVCDAPMGGGTVDPPVTEKVTVTFMNGTNKV